MVETPGFAKTMYCGIDACETQIKADTGVAIRCIPFAQENLGNTCPFCGEPAKHMVLYGESLLIMVTS